MLSAEDLERLITTKRRELEEEKTILGLTAVNNDVEDQKTCEPEKKVSFRSRAFSESNVLQNPTSYEEEISPNLERYIRDHSSQILPAGNDRVSFRLTAAHTRWESAVLQRGTALYVLSVRCTTDCLEGTLACLSPDPEQKFGTITIYNKLTGEPFTWNGPITALSPNLPYENEASCIKINLSKLDLFPNSANLKLINRELVSDFTTKVVVGQTVNDIDIDVFVNIFC